MDEFFQELREIQKKERSLSGLAPVGDKFYQNVSDYLNTLMRKIDNNPFSFESYLLRDAQRIIAEICERREHKISNNAVMNVQRSYQLFKESKIDLKVKVPLNSTPEEEKLYHALISSLIIYREKLMEPIRSYNHQGSDKAPKQSEKSIKSNKILIDDFKNRSTAFEPYEDDLDEFSMVELEVERDIYKKFGHEPLSKEVKVLETPQKLEEIKKTEDVDKSNKNEIKTDDSSSHIKKSSNDQKIPNEILMILEKLPSIMGVDEKVYGPLEPQDVISMPLPNARILLKNQKGRSIQRYK